MVYTLKTINDMEALYYGNANSPFIAKANSPLLTTTSGTYNHVFGAYAWMQANMEANAFGCLPKYVWLRSGFRVITGKVVLNTNQGNTVLGGYDEGGAIAETALPPMKQVSTKIKGMQLPFSVSETIEYLATESEDDVWGGLGALRLFNATQHKEFMNRALLADRRHAAQVASADAVNPKDFETLDAAISSKAEQDFFTNSTYVNYFDPWQTDIDRDSTTDFDSQVVSASGTLGTNGQLTDDSFINWLGKIRKGSGGDPSLFLGSHEAYNEVQSIYTPQVRYNVLGESTVSVDVNGVSTFKGIGVGIHVDTIYGIPYIPSKDAPINSGQTGEIGRIFALDTSDKEGWGYPRIGIQIARPTQYFEASKMTAGFPFLNGNFTERGLYRTMGELIVRHFSSQGKMGDIKQ